MSDQTILTVRDLTLIVKDLLESSFPVVRVRGQVTNLSRPGSGHVYFSIKDEEATLSVVWFKAAPGFGGGFSLAGLYGQAGLLDRLALKNGQEVVCTGRINVYPPRGQYQLVADVVEDAGLGRLFLEFERLKKRLAGLGYFDLERKRPLPSFPVCIGLITSRSGAAIRDFLRIVAESGFACQIRIYPAPVQGKDAPELLARAIKLANSQDFAQVLVLIRGGGSLEDLWAFNSEEVVRAVYESTIPVLTGIGHEVDTSLADLAADVRAATPTHAAALLWPDRAGLLQQIDDLETTLRNKYFFWRASLEQTLASLGKTLALFSPQQIMARLSENLDNLRHRVVLSGRDMLGQCGQALEQAELALRLCPVRPLITRQTEKLDDLSRRLRLAGQSFITARQYSLETQTLRLTGLDPDGPLQRGYTLVYIPGRRMYLRDPDDVQHGMSLEIQTNNGTVKARVEKKQPGKPDPDQQMKLL